MKVESFYLILNCFGKSWIVRDHSIEAASLPFLLTEGWRPVRETPFAPGGADSAPSVLILMERESEERFGFGFNPE